jgi:hypothetical protein
MVTISIDEEYGYRRWVAEMNEAEYQALLARWATMRGLNCLIPVNVVIPQARELVGDSFDMPADAIRCHIHECDDSYLEGSDYQIPPDKIFWIDGVSYNSMDLFRNAGGPRNDKGGT